MGNKLTRKASSESKRWCLCCFSASFCERTLALLAQPKQASCIHSPPCAVESRKEYVAGQIRRAAEVRCLYFRATKSRTPLFFSCHMFSSVSCSAPLYGLVLPRVMWLWPPSVCCEIPLNTIYAHSMQALLAADVLLVLTGSGMCCAPNHSLYDIFKQCRKKLSGKRPFNAFFTPDYLMSRKEARDGSLFCITRCFCSGLLVCYVLLLNLC